jgi:acetylornithine deacetylase/succinyl-diaminopimelate desuccinylase-like protein
MPEIWKGPEMTRETAIADALRRFETGEFKTTVARRVAARTESPRPDSCDDLLRYLSGELEPALRELGFHCQILRDPGGTAPFLFAERIESPELPTVLGYAHGDVVRGMESRWSAGLSPWELVERDGRWYGRGIADNKIQHSINLLAQASVLSIRGSLGFNAKWLIEMGEEIGSPGLHAVCTRHRELLKADVLIASDGPRVNADRPTVFLGSRGEFNIDLRIESRDAAHHSGNWGGLLSNPAIQLSHAIASLVGPSGRIEVRDLVPSEGIPADVRAALADCDLDQGPQAPRIDRDWGEPGLSGAEKVYGWSSLEVLAMEAGTPSAPVGAIPPKAWARCQLRFVVGVAIERVIPAIRLHLARKGFGMVYVEAAEQPMPATRLPMANPWVQWAARSIESSSGRRPTVLPNFGGTIPIWIPHSYPGCRQHAPDEHVPIRLVREAIEVMTGIYWDVPQARAWLEASQAPT